MCTVADDWPAAIWPATESASLIGIEKASVLLLAAAEVADVAPGSAPLVDAAVSMPMTCPAVFTSGPP